MLYSKGMNNEQEIFCQAELTALAAAMPQLHVEYCAWKPSESWTGFCGTPADALRAYLANTRESRKTPDFDKIQAISD